MQTEIELSLFKFKPVNRVNFSVVSHKGTILKTAVEHFKIPFALSLSKGRGILDCSPNGFLTLQLWFLGLSVR